MNKNQRKAIFLDRDGVVNEEIGDYVTSPGYFNMLPHVIPNMARLRNAGFLFIIITNQGGIAKGLYTHEILQQIHEKLIQELAENDLYLTDVFYCPHHPDFGNCLCRKPGSIMIEKALAKHRINPENSFMIGDAERDMQAALAAGIEGFKISSNQNWGFVTDQILKM